LRDDLARRGEAVGQGQRQDGNVERGIFVDLLLHCRRQAKSEDKLVAGRLLELRAEFFEDCLHCGGCVDLELCRLRPSREQRQDNSDHNRHDTLRLQEALPR
jgi:hypothetical protein